MLSAHDEVPEMYIYEKDLRYPNDPRAMSINRGRFCKTQSLHFDLFPILIIKKIPMTFLWFNDYIPT